MSVVALDGHATVGLDRPPTDYTEKISSDHMQKVAEFLTLERIGEWSLVNKRRFL